MRPVLVFRFSSGDEPGRFAEWLDANGWPWRLVALDAGAAVPERVNGVAGIGMMGGPMSVNDALSWVAPMEALLREAVDNGVPVIGHCLGGQLLAKALGADVLRVSRPEIGWIDVEVCGAPAQEWFGGRAGFTTFEWHYEGFDLPRGATRVLTNGINANQAYVIDQRHIGFQGHVEVTPDIVRHWVSASGDELPVRSTSSMQTAADILRDLDARATALGAVADDVYARWSRGLRC
jgi:GMP synthase-like glutamine amidotransferase